MVGAVISLVPLGLTAWWMVSRRRLATAWLWSRVD
jgi:hypothetical protein